MTRVAHERRQRRRWWWWARSEVFIDDAASFNYATLTLEVFHQILSLYITIWPILMQNFQILFVFELKYSPGETHSMLKADCPKLFFDGLVQFFSFNKIINIFVMMGEK